jgi:hypothetical protein
LANYYRYPETYVAEIIQALKVTSRAGAAALSVHKGIVDLSEDLE